MNAEKKATRRSYRPRRPQIAPTKDELYEALRAALLELISLGADESNPRNPTVDLIESLLNRAGRY